MENYFIRFFLILVLFQNSLTLKSQEIKEKNIDKIFEEINEIEQEEENSWRICIKKAKKALEMSRKLNYKFGKAESLRIINKNYLEQKINPNKMLSAFIEEEISIWKDLKDSGKLADAYVTFAKYYEKMQKRPEKSETYYEMALKLFSELNDKIKLYSTLIYYCDNLEKRGKTDLSIQNLIYYSEFADIKDKAYIERRITDLLLDAKNINLALNHAKKVSRLFEYLANKDSLYKSNYKESKFLLKTIEYEINLKNLNQSNSDKFFRIIFVIVLISTILVIGILWFFIRKINLKNKILSDKNLLIEKNSFDLAKKNEELIVVEEELRQYAEEIETQKDHLSSTSSQLEILLEQAITQKTLVENQKLELESIAEELRQQSDTVNAKNIELESLQLAKEKLTRMIVHDFKNPLGTVLASDSITEVRQAGKRIGDYIEDMNTIQQYGDAQLSVNQTNSSLYESAQNALEVMQGAARKKGVQMENQTDSQHFAYYDVRLIGRVLENLLSNAIKYTESGGRIYIRTSLTDKQVLVRVSDTGAGIAEDKFKEIFEPFMSLNARQFANVSATGIGLTFCKMAIEAHESEIKVNSQMGQGTTFTFALKAATIVTKQTPDNLSQAVPDVASDNYNFSDEEIGYLKPFVEQLRATPIYKSSEIKQILKVIDEQSPEIKRWKEQLALFQKHNNKSDFERLLREISA